MRYNKHVCVLGISIFPMFLRISDWNLELSWCLGSLNILCYLPVSINIRVVCSIPTMESSTRCNLLYHDGGIIRSRYCLPFASIWVHPQFYDEVRVAHIHIFYVLSYYVSLFWDVRYDFRIQTMFGSSLSPVICRKVHVLITLFVVSNTYSVVCLLCIFFILYTLCCQFLRIVHFWFPILYSLTC